MAEEKVIVRDLGSIIVSHKEKSQQRPQLAKKMIDFLNSKSSQELSNMQVEDRTKPVLEINKMVYRKTIEAKLGETDVLSYSLYIIYFLSSMENGNEAAGCFYYTYLLKL